MNVALQELQDALDERREVIDMCEQRCHLSALCAAAGRRQHHGIWGGIDKSIPSVTKTKTKTKETRA